MSSQENLVESIIEKNYDLISSGLNESMPLVADLIRKGESIGVIVGNAETGPRSLGHRSLICDGSNPEAVKVLNTVIKNRSPFRPTAPAMLFEDAAEFFDIKKSLINTYYSMTSTVKYNSDSESSMFPTTHVDGTARLQIVEEN